MHMWYDNDIKLNAPYIYLLTIQLNHSVGFTEWLNVFWRTKRLWLRVPGKSFKFQTSLLFRPRMSWHWGKHRVWILSEMRTSHKNDIQSNPPYRYLLTIQLKHFVSLAKWLSIFFEELSGCDFELRGSRLNFRYRSSLEQECLEIQANTECGFTLKRVPYMIMTYIQMSGRDPYSQFSSIIWLVWPNDWVFF